MTRGQDRLVIDNAPADRLAAGIETDLAALALPVIAAEAAEVAAHEARLDAIDKASRGQSLWRQPGADRSASAAAAT
jgi:DNA polymerase-3 subunit epsilon